jgi:hypothetical protein
LFIEKLQNAATLVGKRRKTLACGINSGENLTLDNCVPALRGWAQFLYRRAALCVSSVRFS